jgi:hypothetical protein
MLDQSPDQSADVCDTGVIVKDALATDDFFTSGKYFIGEFFRWVSPAVVLDPVGEGFGWPLSDFDPERLIPSQTMQIIIQPFCEEADWDQKTRAMWEGVSPNNWPNSLLAWAQQWKKYAKVDRYRR